MKPIQEKIIAEVANVHEGSENYLKELVEKAKKSGLENIKFQYIIPGEFGKPKSESYIEFDRLKIKNNVFLEIIEQYSDIKFYFDVFGQESLNKVISLNQKSKNKIDGVKFHTTSSMDFTLIENAAKYFNKIIVSISGLLFSEIAQLVDFLKLNNFKNEVILSYGVQNYPTDIEDVKLMKLLSIKNIFNYKICISDHLPGGDDLSKDIIYYASLLDYDYIEKHISLDNNRGLDDDVAATNIEDFPLILEKLNRIEKLKIGHPLVLNKKELEYRNKAKNAYFSNKHIKIGHIFKETDVYSSRVENNENVPSINMLDIIGRYSVSDIKKNTIIKPENINQNIYGIIIVRAGSNRLNKKCYETLMGTETIRVLIKRVKNCKKLKKIIVATTINEEDDLIEKIAEEEKVDCVRGSNNVYKRLSDVFQEFSTPDYFVRLTGDNVFVDPEHIDQCSFDIVKLDKDYYRHEKVIDGCDFEIISYKYYSSLKYLYANIKDESEYLTIFLNNEFVQKLAPKVYDSQLNYKDYRLTVDHIEDLENCKSLVKAIGNYHFTYEEMCVAINDGDFYKNFHPDDKSININPHKIYF